MLPTNRPTQAHSASQKPRRIVKLFNRTGGIKPARTVTLAKDPTGAPAISLTKTQQDQHVSLTKRSQKAGISLSKRNLAGIRAQAVMILDHSGSMHADYANGKVQTLVERALGFALQVDTDGVVPVIPFDSRVLPTVHVGVDSRTLADGTRVEAYPGVVDRSLWQRQMGTTNLAAAIDVVLAMAKTTNQPIFLLVITDGCPDSKPAATRLIIESARYPIFVKFIAIRDVPYLRTLDDMDGRLLDNVDAKFFQDPSAVTDLEFADAMADEWDTWITAATAAGVLR
jgi:hypothetical protein